MKTHGDKFIIKYEKGSVRNYDLGSGIVIEIAAECNMDIRGNSDQVGIIISAPETQTFFKNGDKVLTHYLASADGNAFQYDGQEYHRVTLSQIFAKINNNDEFELAEDIYLCEDLIVEAKTESGIITTFSGEKKEKSKLVVTHIPSSINKNWADGKINIGDVIMPQDDYNYKFTYNKKEYVKIDHKFIAGVYLDGKS
jgi:co-chaperonin GroES (HSP10)